MLKGNDYCADDIVSPAVCGFIERVTDYTNAPKMAIVHAMYSSMMSGVVSDNWKRE